MSDILAHQGRPVVPSHGVLRTLSINDVTITGGFWAHKQQLNATKSIEHCEAWIEKVGWIGNFDAAIEGRLPQDRKGMSFSDSDVYKLAEAMAWEVGRSGDVEMDRRLHGVVARIAPVQEADGYLNTNFGRPGQGPRYSDLEWGHELYSFGHLIQAAIARGRTHGDDLLVSIARRAADHICETFGPNGIQGVCGHPEIEIALVEFARYTGEQKFLDQARLFVERRGHRTLRQIHLGSSYFQDDQPVRETKIMTGHAVRALYLAAGAIDLAVETEDDELLRALIEQTANTVARRTYITGGMGAHHEGESFGLDYELPPDRAYSETCAGVGSMMVNFRLLLATGEAKYADLIERTLFNVVAVSAAEDGQSFFYTNTLHQREPGSPPSQTEASPRASSSLRAPWFEVSCCPTNVARTLASLSAYIATTDSHGVQIHQYADSEIRALLGSGAIVGIKVSTDYPQSGHIRFDIVEAAPEEWTLSLRVPNWAKAGAVLRAGTEKEIVYPGMTSITRAFTKGDTIDLDLPISPRWVRPDPRVDSVRGSIAVERGPLVMCLESVDLRPGASVNDIRVDSTSPLLDRGGVTSVNLKTVNFTGTPWAYGGDEDPVTPGGAERVDLIPYYKWANRGPSTMRVWLPLDEAVDIPLGDTYPEPNRQR
jgi:DUF1680 family protein